MRIGTPIFDSLNACNGPGQPLLDDEIIVHRGAARWKGGCEYHPSSHEQPLRGGQELRSDIPIASNDPWADKLADDRIELLEDGAVGRR